MKRPQKKFTVVLRYPDYFTDDWPNDTYAEIVPATTWDKAVTKLQKALKHRINRGCRQIHSHEDFGIVIVIAGDPEFWMNASLGVVIK